MTPLTGDVQEALMKLFLSSLADLILLLVRQKKLNYKFRHLGIKISQDR